MLQYLIGRQIMHIGAIVTRLFMGLTTTLFIVFETCTTKKLFILGTANVVKLHDKS